MSGSWHPDRSTFFLPRVSQSVNLREFHVLAQFLKMLDGIFKMPGGHFKMSGGRFKMFGGRGGGLWEGPFRRCVRACVRACVPKLPPRPFFFGFFAHLGHVGCKAAILRSLSLECCNSTFGAILGRFWGHSGAILGPFWGWKHKPDKTWKCRDIQKNLGCRAT